MLIVGNDLGIRLIEVGGELCFALGKLHCHLVSDLDSGTGRIVDISGAASIVVDRIFNVPVVTGARIVDVAVYCSRIRNARYQCRVCQLQIGTLIHHSRQFPDDAVTLWMCRVLQSAYHLVSRIIL
jgi:hypothetical protein